MMNNSQIAILILAGNPSKYRNFISLIKSGWYKNALNLGFKVFFYSGGHDRNYIYDSCEIRVKESDAIHNCYKKFISAKNVLIANHPNIKLIFRTNVSSFIDIDNFEKYIQKANFTDRSFHGFRGSANKYSEIFYKYKALHLLLKHLNLGPNIDFYSGAGLFIGMKLCNELSYIDDKNYLIDDVEIGYQVKNQVLHDLNYERINITENFEKIDKNIFSKMVNEDFLFHYKFKTTDRNRDAYLLGKFIDPDYRGSYITK